MKYISFAALITLSLLASGVNPAHAQADSCLIRLNNAGMLFDQGDYDGTINLLNEALAECSLSKSDKIQANKVLILSYLKVDNLEAAEKTTERIMKIDPYYEPDKLKDDPKLSALFQKYKARPQLWIGIRGGVNLSHVNAVNSYSIVHPDGASGFDEYNNKTGFQLGALAEYRAWRELWLALEFQFRQTKYEHQLFEVEGSTILFSEKLSYFDIPVSVKYNFLKGEIKPYVQAGAVFSILTGAISTTSRDDQKDLVDRFDSRNGFTAGYFGGGGVSYTIKGFRLTADVRYARYPRFVNKEGTRYADPVNVFKYYYIDDDFKLDCLTVNAGISYVLSYRNQKIK